MSKVRSLTNRLVVFLIVILSGARMALARVWPFNPPEPKTPVPKVFALTDAEWLALRAMDGNGKDTQESQAPESATTSAKGTTQKKPESTQDKKATAPANKQQKSQGADKKTPSPATTEKKAQSDDKKQQPRPDAKQGEKKNTKPNPSVGGGDGDMDGGGG